MSWTRTTFASLRNPNYRRYFVGQTISGSGSWMQRVGQAWLVLELTGSGTLLGVTLALQSLPLLLAGFWGGLLSDRVEKRRLLLFTQSISGALAVLLGALTAMGVVRIWMVFVLAFALGLVRALDNPARQSFIFEMVGPELVSNAVTLHSIVMSVARAVGPAMAGLLISTVGLAWSFYVNGVSFLAVVVALLAMEPSELLAPPPVNRAPRQLREGLAYVRRTPALLSTVMLLGTAGLFAFEFQVTLPLLAVDAFGGAATTYGVLFSALGLGSACGGVVVAGSLRASSRTLVTSAWAFALLMLAVAAVPNRTSAIVALFAMGAASIAFKVTANSMLQLNATPEMRGRVMSFWSICMQGTTPIGAPLMGFLAETAGARVAIAVGGLTTAAIALLVRRQLVRKAPAALRG